MQVDASRCIACFNCIDACPVSGLTYGISAGDQNAETQPVAAGQPDRRQFISAAPGAIMAAGAPLMLIGPARSRGDGSGQGKGRNKPATPPGALSLKNFNNNCTACQACVEVCPTGVLQPTWTKHGIEFIMQPEMDYKSGFCNYDCVRCSEICPTDAIMKISVEKKKLTQIGVAHLSKNQCIVYSDHTDCGACAEHCPTKAVSMVDWKYGLRVPRINEATCIGCGACEYPCPTEPRAIFVVRREVHRTAEKPVFEEIDKEVDEEEDFPF
jgi:ferredoxin